MCFTTHNNNDHQKSEHQYNSSMTSMKVQTTYNVRVMILIDINHVSGIEQSKSKFCKGIKIPVTA